MKMRTIFLALLMVSASLAGCFGDDEKVEAIVETDVWDFDKPELTWYHFANAEDAWGNEDFDFEGRNIPYEAVGSYLSLIHF